jgi:hypothetical protein
MFYYQGNIRLRSCHRRFEVHMLFAFVGDAGNAILFICSLVAATAAAIFTFAYAAHCYLVVTQTTAAGLDRVEWPDEPVYDWLYEALYVGGLLLLWLAPAGILSRALHKDLLPNHGALRFLVLAWPGLWLLFPVGLLSSLGSASRWVPLSTRVLVRLLRVFPQTLLFYLCTAVLFGAAAALAYAGIFTSAWYALPVAAVGGSAVLLVHARLVGRLAWLMGQVDHKPAAKKKAKSAGPHKKSRRLPRALAAHDPWAKPEGAPEEVLPEDAPPAPGYHVVEVGAEEAPPPRPSYLDPEPDPYTLADAGPEAEHALPPQPRPLEMEKAHIEREIKLRERIPPNPPPAVPLVSGVYSFPLYEGSHQAWFTLTLCALATGGLLRLMVMFKPF